MVDTLRSNRVEAGDHQTNVVFGQKLIEIVTQAAAVDDGEKVVIFDADDEARRRMAEGTPVGCVAAPF